ncbi:MAG: hypothetical protein QY306_10830 [Anaerolineales bacterium]|nr:MAG: hypothetical protein QY306_10830 [Anaerolineales bacterium]
MKDLYALLLNLFPSAYRDEYGEELQAVFGLSLDGAMRSGGGEPVRLVLRELVGLPKAIVHEHLRERRKQKMTGKFASRFDFEPGSRTEALVALAPFLLFGGIPVVFGWVQYSGVMPLWLAIVFVLVFWGSGLSLFVIGFKKGAPRWFMPYLGLPLPIICVLAFNTFVNPEWRGFPFLEDASWFVRQFVHQGMIWVWLLLSVLLIFLLTRFIPRLHSFHQRLRSDWTLLSFLLYGAAPLVIVFSFEEFKNEEPYLLLSFLTLALFGWLYLRSTTPWVKFWSLLGGLTLAMSVAILGQTLLYESSFPFTTFPRWTTTLSTVIMWIWMVLFMFASAAINLLPRATRIAMPASRSSVPFC